MGITIIFIVITFVISLIYSLFRKRDIKKIIKQEIEDALRYKYIPIKEKNTDRNLLDSPKGNTINNDTCNYSNNHFIIYGASGTCKTYWLKKNYLEKFNIDYRIYSPHIDEWDSRKIISDLNEINQLNDVTIVLDDVENEIKNCKLINDLFLNGRHRNIQCIIIAHTTKIISNQIRQNISHILITTNNTPEFYEQLKKHME